MVYRTAILSTFDAYLETGGDTAEEQNERKERVRSFPFAVMLELAFAERDYADRWCWSNLAQPEANVFKAIPSIQFAR